MIIYIIRFLADFLKIFARRNYYNSFFSKSTNIKNRIFFWFFSVASEVLLFYCSHLFAGSKTITRALFFIFFNFIINLLLSLFYEADKIAHRLTIIISLQAINQLSEILMGVILFAVIPQLFEKENGIQDTYVIVCSGILSFLILTFISALWKIKVSSISFRHLFLMCTTPIVSVTLLLLIPFQMIISQESSLRVFIILILLLLINIINHFLLQDIILQMNLKTTIINQQKQLNYQSEKFSQLSNAYKETRRVVHEVKRYNSYITSCVQKKQYEKIIDFIRESNKELEERFVKINTGNLVIDTFITNYDSMAKDKGIKYDYEIKIDKDEIPITDYDLCIILGNLLDNSFNEAALFFDATSSYDKFHISTRLVTTDTFFVINNSNTLSGIEKTNNKEYNPEHGFGIMNIQEIAQKYGGLYFQNAIDNIYETTISIPITPQNLGEIPKEKRDYSYSCTTPPRFSKPSIVKGFKGPR